MLKIQETVKSFRGIPPAGFVEIGKLKGDQKRCKSYAQHFIHEYYDFDRKEVFTALILDIRKSYNPSPNA